MQSPETVDSGDGATGELRRHVGRDGGKPQNLNIKRLTRCLHRFEILPGVMPEAEIQLLPRD